MPDNDDDVANLRRRENDLKWSFQVKKELLCRLHTFFQDKFATVLLTSGLRDGSAITHPSIEHLINYPNTDRNSVVSLTISGERNYDYRLEVSFKRYSGISYFVRAKEEESYEIERKVTNLLEEFRPNYRAVSDRSLLVKFITGVIISVLGSYLLLTSSSKARIAIGVLLYAFPIAFMYIDDRVFPKSEFRLGAGVQRAARAEFWRTSVIAAVAVTLACAPIVAWIT